MAMTFNLAISLAVATYSPGDQSCGRWIEIHRAKPDIEFISQETWLNGYLTAFNAYVRGSGGDILGKSDRQGASAWMSQYCQNHPLETIQQAADGLIAALLTK
jgi:hypothetical protein